MIFLSECCAGVQTETTSDAAICIFDKVHEGKDVHWFHGQQSKARLHEGISTSRHVDGDGWWKITSILKHTSSHKSFKCSLMGKSGRYLRGALLRTPPKSAPHSKSSLLTSTWSLLCVSICLLWCWFQNRKSHLTVQQNQWLWVTKCKYFVTALTDWVFLFLMTFNFYTLHLYNMCTFYSLHWKNNQHIYSCWFECSYLHYAVVVLNI